MEWNLLPNQKPKIKERPLEVLADEIATLAYKISGGDTTYHCKFVEIEEAQKRVTSKDRAIMTCYLGDITDMRLSGLAMQDLLRVELAEDLLNREERSGNMGIPESVQDRWMCGIRVRMRRI